VAEQSEEKTLPASDKKLRDARRKGQVPHSKDLISAVAFIVVIVYLLFFLPDIQKQLQQLVDILIKSADQPFSQTWPVAIDMAGSLVVRHSFTLAGLVAASTILAGMSATFGPVFSFDPLKPQFDHINPAKGAKRIVSLHNIVEFSKAVVKLLVLVPTFWLVLRGSIQSLIEIPTCGPGCVATVALALLRPLTVTAVVAFLVIGMFDILTQRKLFLREMRMTKTEAKREAKDLEGDPYVRGERRRLRNQLAAEAGRIGIRRAVMVVIYKDSVVGIRYAKDTPIPTVVCKASGAAGLRMIAIAHRLRIPPFTDAKLVATLSARHTPGSPVAPDLYVIVAKALLEAGIIVT